MISVYRRTSFIRQALQSVLAQAPEDMEIEVVCDGPPDPVHSEVEQILQSVGSDRVSWYRHPNRAGHPEIFNVCVRRARGHWIHILHDDDWVAPGFYSALSEGVRQVPEIGAAFCRHDHVDEQGRFVQRSSLERETPGVVEGWLDRIACLCRLQVASVVVRREAYERLGGYCAQARSAFDWEMWQRIAANYSVWFEPRVLAFFRESHLTESASLMASGGQIADARAALSVSRTYLPPAAAETLERRAAEFYAMRALDLARLWMNKGDAGSALANLREAVLWSQSEEVCNRLLGLLGQRRGLGR
jgi:glycosyltransferase involved in cell wall biosynthesis